ncbi:MAG: serine/threonine-protein kinase [Planctomycetota bacterium]|nr:serine/threonine-protein kinase [Planctomycetota bacterium]MDG1983686.1 serine/threonine-protein kinase [Planctomycetota bacterium]
MAQTHLSLFDLAPGKVLLDRYLIDAPHRENGMCAAFRVTDQESGALRELQAFPASLFENKAQAEAFAETLGRWSIFDDAAFARAQELQVLGDGAVLAVFEFPEGKALRDLASDRGPWDAAEVVEIGLALLAGLENAHARGLVHGDIKPSTIFVGDHGPLLVDGGVTPGLWAAKHLGTRTALIGTPYYAPLEQFGGDAPDERSDLYNLATVMYELLTGAMPWKGRSFIEVFQSKMQPSAPAMSVAAPGVTVDPALEAAIAGGLKGSPKDRHASAKAFRSALAALSI